MKSIASYQSWRKNKRRDNAAKQRKLDKITNVVDNTLKRLMRSTLIDSNECWIWSLRKNTDGYGQTEFKINNEWRQISVHRLSAHLYLGMPINSELYVLHKIECKSKACWNPNHLYLGTQSDNSKDAVASQTHNMASRECCKLGHPLDGRKFSTRDGWTRYCKECSRNSAKLHRSIKNA